jgi:hypothetical protein
VPLSAAFTVTQPSGNPAIVTLTDTSTGSDALVKSRVVYLAQTDGTFLTISDPETSVVIVAEVAAICYIGGMTLQSEDELITITVDDPDDGTITIAEYTQTAGDTTLAILVTNLIAAINDDVGGYGYTAENYDETTFNIIARAGVGATINDEAALVSYTGGSTTNTFDGGVTEDILPISGEDYNYWPYADTVISLDLLDQDSALSITVEWLGDTNNILYASNQLVGLTGYGEEFDYNLTTMLAANPLLVNDNSFWRQKTNLRLFIDSGNQAIVQSSDIASAQLCYDLETNLMLNSEYYFNESTSS